MKLYLSTLRSDKLCFDSDSVSAKTLNSPSLHFGELRNDYDQTNQYKEQYKRQQY